MAGIVSQPMVSARVRTGQAHIMVQRRCQARVHLLQAALIRKNGFLVCRFGWALA